MENYSVLRKDIFKNDVNTSVSISDLNKTDETERSAIYSHFVGEYDITEEDYFYIKNASYQPNCVRSCTIPVGLCTGKIKTIKCNLSN